MGFLAGHRPQELVSLNVAERVWNHINLSGGPRDVKNGVGLFASGQKLYMYGNCRDGPGFVSVFRVTTASPKDPFHEGLDGVSLDGPERLYFRRSCRLPSPLRECCSAAVAYPIC